MVRASRTIVCLQLGRTSHQDISYHTRYSYNYSQFTSLGHQKQERPKPSALIGRLPYKEYRYS